MRAKSPQGVVATHFGSRVSDFGLGADRRRRLRRAGAAIRNPQSAIRNGFTLIELLLVLVILATLAAIVVPKLTGRGEQARVTAAQTQISNFKVALDSFEIDCGRYPNSDEGLNALITQPTNVTGWKKGGYLDAIPNDPWGNKYVYKFPGQHNPNGYDLYSCGASGVDGGADNIGNWTATPQ
jgi:general secretion pathway protein G